MSDALLSWLAPSSFELRGDIGGLGACRVGSAHWHDKRRTGRKELAIDIDDGVMLYNCAFGEQLRVQMGALQGTAGILEHSKSGKAQNMRGKVSILESKPDAEAAWKPPG